MDEIGTPDSSRIWDGEEYAAGRVVERSKEGFRKMLLQHFPDPDILVNKSRMPERLALAADTELPRRFFEETSRIYLDIARTITGTAVSVPLDPRAEIVAMLRDELGLVCD